MRHRVAAKKFGRNTAWRSATIRDIAKAAIVHERICTTKPRAKEARKLVDRLITLGKNGTLAARRQAFAILCDHSIVSNLFNKTALRFRNRQGGYTRIISLSYRRGDNAQLAYLELTERQEVMVSKPKSSAVAKTKELDVLAETKTPKDALPQSQPAPEKKEVPIQPISPKVSPKQELPKPDRDQKKPGKSLMGSLKKMFRRKVGE